MNIKETLEYEIPEGWWRAFGEQMCKEIQDEIDTWSEEEIKDFYITAKEKYGELRIYCVIGNDTLDAIFDKYEKLSTHTCIQCGRPASWMTKGWISPVCDKCANEMYDHYNNSYSAQSDWNEYVTAIKKED